MTKKSEKVEAPVEVKSAKPVDVIKSFIANAGGTGFVTVSTIQLQKLVDALEAK